MVQKIHSKMYPVLCTNIHHDVTDFVNHRMVKNTKTWISWIRNIIFLWQILNLYLRWHILRSYRFLAEVTFKVQIFDIFECSTQSSSNYSSQFWIVNSIPLLILHHSSFSWQNSPINFKLTNFLLWIKAPKKRPNF